MTATSAASAVLQRLPATAVTVAVIYTSIGIFCLCIKQLYFRYKAVSLLISQQMSDTSANNKRIAKNTLFLYFRQFLTMAVAIYTSRIVLNVLGVVDYGVYNVVGGMVAMFAFLNSALAQATQRFIAYGLEKDDLDTQRKTFSMLMNVHLLIAVILLVLCETVGLWLFYNKLVIPQDRMEAAFWVMQCSIATLMISVTQVPYNASIFGHERMNAYAYISIFEVLLKLGVVIMLQYLFSDKLLAYGIMMMATQFVVAMTYRVYCLQKFNNCKYSLYWSRPVFKQIFNFSSWSLIGNLAYTMNGQGMNFLINIFFGPVYNAAKGIATAVEAAVSSFVTNFQGASIPQIIKSYAAGDMEYCYKLNFKSSKFSFFLFMMISLPIISIINPILSLWLVEVPHYANIFCVLSLLYIQANTMSGTLQNVAQATGRIRNFQLSNGVLKLLPLPFVYVLYKFGAPINTYLYVLIIFSVLGMFVQLFALRSIINDFPVFSYLKQVTLPEIAVFIVPSLISFYCYNLSYGSLIVAVATAVGVFILTGIIVWLGGLTKHEREWIKSIVSAKIRK